MAESVNPFLISKEATVKDAMKQMKNIGQKVIFVIDENNKLFGALSDGDIRKWILSEGKLTENVHKVCNQQPRSVSHGHHEEHIKGLMLDRKIECIPVISEDNEVVNVITWDEIFAGKIAKHREKIQIPVVIMAGGKGSRLDPFTKILPKALIPIGEKPIVEIIMDNFGEFGVREFYVSVNHKARMIRSYFEEHNSKYKVHYIEEEKPLGTAGSLKLLENEVSGSILVTNCDIIVESDYSDLVNFHKENKNDMTLVVSHRHYVIPYGICEIENGGQLKSIKEKPEYDLLVNTGMYVLESDMLKHLPENERFDITDLIEKAKAEGCKIGVFPISEKSWIDIGQWDEYHKAIEQFRGNQ